MLQHCKRMEENKNPITTISFVLPPELKIKEKARRVLSLRFEHPDWTGQQIGNELGITQQRVSAILNHPRVLAAMPMIARQRISGLVPDAVAAYASLLKQNDNLQVKEKAAGKVLAEKKVFDAPTIIVKGELTFKHVSELQQIVAKAAEQVGNDVVDAELVDETGNDSPSATQPAIQRPPSSHNPV